MMQGSTKMTRKRTTDWCALGAKVWFDGPDGERLFGEIIRTSSNPDYFHVEVDGHRYEVSLNDDHMSSRR
jgi:hypothetical protein